MSRPGPKFDAERLLESVASQSASRDFDPKWHHITAGLIALPDDKQWEYFFAFKRFKEADQRIPDALDVFESYRILQVGQKTILASVLQRTDYTPHGYARMGHIGHDLAATGYPLDRTRTKGDQVDELAEGIERATPNIISRRGILGGHSLRLIHPTNARALREKSIELPDEVKNLPRHLQLAYLAFRLIAPRPDGSGMVKQSEITQALSLNFSSEIWASADDIVSKTTKLAGVMTPESVANITAKQLAKNNLFERSSLRYGADRWVKLKGTEL